MLFQSARNFTLPHLLIGITFAIAGVLAFRLWNNLPLWAAGIASLVIGLLASWMVFRLFRLVLPCLGKLVVWGVLAPPDQNRLDRKVASYLGRSGTVDR